MKKVVTYGTTYPIAVQLCKDENAFLPVVRNDVEREQFREVTNNEEVWLGLERVDKCSYWRESESGSRNCSIFSFFFIL